MNFGRGFPFTLQASALAARRTRIPQPPAASADWPPQGLDFDPDRYIPDICF